MTRHSIPDYDCGVRTRSRMMRLLLAGTALGLATTITCGSAASAATLHRTKDRLIKTKDYARKTKGKQRKPRVMITQDGEVDDRRV